MKKTEKELKERINVIEVNMSKDVSEVKENNKKQIKKLDQRLEVIQIGMNRVQKLKKMISTLMLEINVNRKE